MATRLRSRNQHGDKLVVSVCLTIFRGSLTVVDITAPVVAYSSKQIVVIKGKHENEDDGDGKESQNGYGNSMFAQEIRYSSNKRTISPFRPGICQGRQKLS